MYTLSIIPCLGLGNRMRAIASGIYVGRKLNLPTTIYWNKTNDCNAHFHELFNEINIQGVKLYENLSLTHKIATKWNLRIPKILQRYAYDQCIYNFNMQRNGDIFSIIKNQANILLCSCHTMCIHYPLNKIFSPSNDLLLEINEITNQYPNNIIGIHIRRTDNAQSIIQSKDEAFINILNHEIKINPNVHFYLATDDLSVKKHFIKLYGSRIITSNDDINRNTIKGMKSAIKDLYCLSKTNKIIGSAYSSYSEIAAELGNIKLEIAR